MQTNSSSIVKQLVDAGYSQLFLTNDKAEEIWQKGKNQKDLEQLIEANDTPPYVRFLAAEVLRGFEIKISKSTHKQLAKAYAYALQHSSANQKDHVFINGNAWGLLYKENDMGDLGAQFLRFENGSIAPLVKLLDDANDGILYEGSEEATMGNAYGYRIKDFAAFYLSKITNQPITFYQDLTKRDAEIERFKKELAKN